MQQRRDRLRRIVMLAVLWTLLLCLPLQAADQPTQAGPGAPVLLVEVDGIITARRPPVATHTRWNHGYRMMRRFGATMKRLPG